MKELDEALDAGWDVAGRIVDGLSSASPGGKQLTLDELLHTVTDGQVRQSLSEMYDSILTMVTSGKKPDLFEMLAKVGEAVTGMVGVFSEALSDGRLTPNEIVNGVTDGHIREGLQRAIDGAEKIPAELSKLGPLGVIMLAKKNLGRLRELKKKLPK